MCPKCPTVRLRSSSSRTRTVRSVSRLNLISACIIHTADVIMAMSIQFLSPYVSVRAGCQIRLPSFAAFVAIYRAGGHINGKVGAFGVCSCEIYTFLNTHTLIYLAVVRWDLISGQQSMLSDATECCCSRNHHKTP